jgi:hypothetical protein
MFALSSYRKDFVAFIALYLARNVDPFSSQICLHSLFAIGTLLLRVWYILMPEKLYSLTTTYCLS